MATNDGNDRDDKAGTTALLTPGEVLALQLGQTATIIAGHLLREQGYQPTVEQFREIARLLAAEARVAGAILVEVSKPPTDEQLDGAAMESAVNAIRSVCGAPPARTLN